jgi:hypothetical protein
VKVFLTEIQQSKAKKKKGKLSAASVRNLKTYLSCIFNEAVDDELIQANPAARTGKLIKKTDRTNGINLLSWDEKAKFE